MYVKPHEYGMLQTPLDDKRFNLSLGDERSWEKFEREGGLRTVLNSCLRRTFPIISVT